MLTPFESIHTLHPEFGILKRFRDRIRRVVRPWRDLKGIVSKSTQSLLFCDCGNQTKRMRVLTM